MFSMFGYYQNSALPNLNGPLHRINIQNDETIIINSTSDKSCQTDFEDTNEHQDINKLVIVGLSFALFTVTFLFINKNSATISSGNN